MNALKSIFSATTLRYLLAAAGGAMVATGKINPEQWETISGALLVVIPLIVGLVSSQQSRVVVDGRRVPVKDLPHATETLVTEQARTAISRKPSLLEQLFGKR